MNIIIKNFKVNSKIINVLRFTLVELLVVIAVIGILSSLLIPALAKARIKTKLAVCKNNMKQVGIATACYQDNSPLSHPPIFRNATSDWPHEGNALAKDKAGPGNPAIWTYPYLDDHQNVFFCPLFHTEKTFHETPEISQGQYLWGTSVYIFGKKNSNSDPYASLRDGINAGAATIANSNDVSEGVMMFDLYNYHEVLGIDSTDYYHYNTLMLDGRVHEPAKSEIQMNKWLFNTSGWGGS